METIDLNPHQEIDNAVKFMTLPTNMELHPQWAMEKAQRLSKIGSYEVDIKNSKSTWSSQSAINFGYPAATAMHTVDWDSVLHPDDKDTIRTLWKTCIEEKKDWDLEYRIVRPNGEGAIIHGLGTIMLGPDGEALKMIGTLHDVTERRRIDAKLRDQEAKLIHASRLSSLGEMAAGIAHEINNPLTVILAKAVTVQKALKSTGGSENLIADCEQTIKMVHRIEAIIRGLRAFACDGEKLPFSKASIKGVVDDALMVCQRRFTQGGVDLVLNIESESEGLECKSVQVSQVIVNLLNNAFDAVQTADAKTVELRVKRNQNWVEILISDSGAGVPAEIRQKIMEPFFTTKEIGKGIGLGLSISMGIAKDHGGKLYLDEAYANTTFVFALPVGRNRS